MSAERSLVRTLGTARGALVATASLVTAVLGVIFLLVPSWRPLPRDRIEASVQVRAVEHNVALEEWARRQYTRDPARRLRELVGSADVDVSTSTGMVLYVVLRAEGFKRRSISLRTRIYDARTREESTTEAPTLLPRAGRLRIDAPSRSSVQLLLVAELDGLGGSYFVRVEAYDDGGILAYDDSPMIRG